MTLPGICQGCRQLVVWNGKRWKNPGQYGGAHHCPIGVRCGAFMPQCQERCDRFIGHKGTHRSRYAMDNERLAKRRAA